MDIRSTRALQHTQTLRLNERQLTSLTFVDVDGIAFAAERGKQLGATKKIYLADEVGPLLELMHLAYDEMVPSLDRVPWLSLGDYSELYEAFKAGVPTWSCSSTRRLGIVKAAEALRDEAVWLKFVSDAERATASVGFPRKLGLQLVAAIEELIDNISLHSKMAESGWAVFKAAEKRFEFVVSDRGIGVLRSLRQCSEFQSLQDHGDALEIALTDGCSRYGKGTQHGNGFRPLFIGLSNLNGTLRFRSGDHALLINGQNPKVIPWRKAAKPKISGFSASVSCRL
jgi:hypothetical protein